MVRRLGDPGALTVAINSRGYQSFRHDGQAERQRLGAELLALLGKPVTVEGCAHLVLTGVSNGIADFDAADRHADQAARIADRYHLPAVAMLVSIHRALREAVDGNMATSEQPYRQAAAQPDMRSRWPPPAAPPRPARWPPGRARSAGTSSGCS
jgi:hypothetical protein